MNILFSIHIQLGNVLGSGGLREDQSQSEQHVWNSHSCQLPGTLTAEVALVFSAVL